MRAKRTQVFLVIGALVLFVLLFLTPKIASKSATKAPGGKTPSFQNASVDVFLKMAQKTLSPEINTRIEKFERLNLTDSVAEIWYSLKRPDLASHYHELTARKNNSLENWLKAGARYYYSVKFTQDESEIPVLYQCAMRCLNKAIELDNKNSEAKILLGSCYLEGSESPMEGISLLREVEKTDSNNVDLQLAFASFSVKSGQLDKAISRFNKVINIDSNYVEVYLHLADVFERQGLTLKTIAMLEKYSAKTSDITAKIEVDKYIKQLKTNINN